MATRHRKSASAASQAQLPKLPINNDWPASLTTWLARFVQALDARYDVNFEIESAGTKQPLRAALNFVGATVADDLVNDRTTVTIGGGSGAAPLDAQYLVLATNATLTVERVFTPGTGLGAVDSGAGAAYTLNLANTAVTPGAYGSATQVASFTVDQQGRLTAAANVAITYPVPTVVGGAFTVATLPAAPPQGTRAWVTDATAPAFLAPLVGLGAVVCPAFYDGTNWIAA